ncbi:MAG: hypothetical protein RMN52_07315 [Anaerolineae bacterium]|nr:hypothetical protein [Candidatus Roseilinea sp.]MDW8449795.1 hypothetical protein [Anaerolineae bacterium]
MKADQGQTVISFYDADNRSEALAIVRKSGDQISLTLSIMKGGDIEVFLDQSTCLKLIQALQEAADN